MAAHVPERSSAPVNIVIIPGPLPSFLRMAGISQKVVAEDVLPELAHNVYAQGFQDGRETEYLLLLQRYVRQARALQSLAGPNGDIRVNRCEDAGPLLQVIGYRLRKPCGQKDTSLLTLNPESAFITIDSGFPLTRLEEALENNTPFVYSIAPSAVPALLKPSDWTNISTWRKSFRDDLLDVLLRDAQVARLYWAFGRIDSETRLALERSPGLWNLLPYAAILDFYGSQICIRSGKVLVPGGVAAEPGWRDLVGANPGSPGEFVPRLLAQDRGWMAAYFDTLARVPQAQQAHLTQHPRLRNLYQAFVQSDPKSLAAKASYRKAPALLILFARQQWQPDGQPQIPGSVDLWKQIVGKRARRWNRPEQVLEAMVSYSRLTTDSGPLQIYLTLGALESEHSPQNSLSPETLLLLANTYAQFSSWYLIFSEFPQLGDASITQFVHVAGSLDRISNQELRGNALGIFQANLGLWQILARQGEIPAAKLDSSWQKVINPFERVSSSEQLFDAGCKSLGDLMFAATGRSSRSQDELIDLLAGPPQESVEGRRIRNVLARRMRLVMDDQRLTSLDTLVELGNGLNAMAHGAHSSERLIALSGELREFEMPRPIFTQNEKDQWAPGVYSQQHAELQVRTDMAKVIEAPGSPARLEAARGQLTPFLRDTLVGLNYAYYEPPGSQILHINPLFVRSHDFSGRTVVGAERVWRASTLFDIGAPAGGGAYLLGSLADLPYVLAETEQDFIAPENVQALIWQQLVPGLVASSTLSRWWSVSPQELHAVALLQESGEELLTASVSHPELREKIVAIFSDRMSPQSLARVEAATQPQAMAAVIGRLMPADTFYLAAEFPQRFPQENAAWGPAGAALEKLSLQYPAEVSLQRISKDFGIPHPTLAQTYGRQLLSVKPFPAFAGSSTRLFGEFWDSSNLYWARLADERNDSPEMLNVLSPQLTRLLISKIFATDFEDWPAVVRAMHETGDEFMQGKVSSLPAAETTAQR